MKIKMKNLLFKTLLMISIVFVSSSIWAESQKKEYGIIINLAGKQRMLTQKMTKEILLMHAKVDVEKNRDNLNQTVQLFSKTLTGLRNGDESLQLPPAKSGLIKVQLDTVRLIFKDMELILERIIAGEMPSYDASMEISEKEPLLLDNMNIVVEMYEQESRDAMYGKESFLGIEINLAGKQRMLTQKMTKEVILIYLDSERRKNKRLLRETYTLFDKTLKGLKHGDGDLGLPGTTEKNIEIQIDAVLRIWSEMSPIVKRSYDIMVDKISREELEKAAELNVALLEEMDKTVTMYQELAK
ncbi:MAG: type IV pili methyl-accepting chemotaxis transducer N-terminal domain-containing protein [Candidatus Scalindua sp.]